MTSSRQRGNENERKAAQKLRDLRYKVQRRQFAAVWRDGKSMPVPSDLFGIFDGIAMRTGELRYYQVTTVREGDAGGDSPAKRRRNLEQWAREFYGPRGEFNNLFPAVTVELWTHRGGRAKKSDRVKRGFFVEAWSPLDGGWIAICPEGYYAFMNGVGRE